MRPLHRRASALVVALAAAVMLRPVLIPAGSDATAAGSGAPPEPSRWVPPPVLAATAAPASEPSSADPTLHPSGRAAAGQPQAAIAPERVSVVSVEAALARLERLGESIEQRQLDEERAAILERSRELAAIEAPEPIASDMVDERGQRWVKLQYPTGEVRYELAPE